MDTDTLELFLAQMLFTAFGLFVLYIALSNQQKRSTDTVIKKRKQQQKGTDEKRTSKHGSFDDSDEMKFHDDDSCFLDDHKEERKLSVLKQRSLKLFERTLPPAHLLYSGNSSGFGSSKVKDLLMLPWSHNRDDLRLPKTEFSAGYSRCSSTSSLDTIQKANAPSPWFDERLTGIFEGQKNDPGVPLLDIQSFQATETIGIDGGCIAVAGCSVLFPHMALEKTTAIHLNCFFNVKVKDSDFQIVSPAVSLEPSDLLFQKDVIVTLPTCYFPADKTKFANLLIITKAKRSNWDEHTNIKHTFLGSIVFKTNHFSLFTALVHNMWNFLLGKSMYYVGYVKRLSLEKASSQSLIWCICDNLPHMIAQIESSMKPGRNYERVIESESFILKHGQGIKLTTQSTDGLCDVNPFRKIISNRDVWRAWSLRKPTFALQRKKENDAGVVKLEFELQTGPGYVSEPVFARSGEYAFAWNSIPARNQPNQFSISDCIINNIG